MPIVEEIDFVKLANFQPKQLEAFDKVLDPANKYILYGGAAAGGKSYFLRWTALALGMYFTSKYNITGIPIGLFSEDYPTLKDRQISRIKREFPEWLGQLKETNDQGYIFKAHSNYGGFAILLRNLDDPSKYASTEFAAECVEELTKNPRETFDDLRFRLRYPGIDDVKFVAATNPGEIGHAWVKNLWIEPDIKNPDIEQNKFFYVPAKVTDNIYVSKEYVMQLESLPDQKRKAYLDGSWDIFAGQVLSEWKKERHVIEPFHIPQEWNRYIGMDWGVNKPFAVIWIAEDTDGRAYVYRELYMNGEEFEKNFGKPLTPKRLGRVINSLRTHNGELEPLKYVVGDPSMWNNAYFGKGAKALEGGESIAEVMSKFFPMVRGDNDRINGLARFREWLAGAPDGKPYLQVFKTCYNTIQTLPSLVYDKHAVEDVDSDGADHIYDALRYWIMSRPAKTPVQQSDASPIRKSYLRQIQQNKLDKYWKEFGA